MYKQHCHQYLVWCEKSKSYRTRQYYAYGKGNYNLRFTDCMEYVLAKTASPSSLISSSPDCKKSYFGNDYRGTLNVTIGGVPCQRWDSQMPHTHDKNKEDSEFSWDSSVEVKTLRDIYQNFQLLTLDILHNFHYSDVIMVRIASQIISLTTVYSTVYSGADHRKHQSSTSVAFVLGIHRWLINSCTKGQ